MRLGVQRYKGTVGTGIHGGILGYRGRLGSCGGTGGTGVQGYKKVHMANY